MRVIPHAVITAAFMALQWSRQRRAARWVLPKQEHTYLFFGQLRPYKGLERLVRVFASLSEQERDVADCGGCRRCLRSPASEREPDKHKNMAVHPLPYTRL